MHSELDLDSAADTLAAAFNDYAWTRWVIPEDGYTERLLELQLLYLSHAVSHGVVITASDHLGVAALLPVAAPDPEPEVMERVVELHGENVGKLVLDLPRPDDAWVVETLGVHPEHQGRGIGGQLLNDIIDRFGENPLYLETAEPANVRLYERFGFETVGEYTSDGPIVWSMIRSPACRVLQHQ